MAAVCCGLTFPKGLFMKTELDGRISAGVRRGRAGVAALFHALETRMFPHFCMFSRGRRAKVPSSLKIKNIGEKREREEREEREECGLTPATPATPAKPLSMRVSEQHYPGATPADPGANACKTPPCRTNAGPLNQLRLSGLTKPGSAP